MNTEFEATQLSTELNYFYLITQLFGIRSMPNDQRFYIRFLVLQWDISLGENYSVECMDWVSVPFVLPYCTVCGWTSLHSADHK